MADQHVSPLTSEVVSRRTYFRHLKTVNEPYIPVQAKKRRIDLHDDAMDSDDNFETGELNIDVDTMETFDECEEFSENDSEDSDGYESDDDIIYDDITHVNAHESYHHEDPRRFQSDWTQFFDDHYANNHNKTSTAIRVLDT